MTKVIPLVKTAPRQYGDAAWMMDQEIYDGFYILTSIPEGVDLNGNYVDFFDLIYQRYGTFDHSADHPAIKRIFEQTMKTISQDGVTWPIYYTADPVKTRNGSPLILHDFPVVLSDDNARYLTDLIWSLAGQSGRS